MSEKVMRKNSFMGMILRGTGIAVIITLAAILIFAGIIKAASLNSSVIKPINQFIKIISIFLGCFTALSGSKGFLKGALTGLMTSVITILIFLILGSGLEFDFYLLLDVVFSVLVGAISGVITVNIRKA